MTRNVGRRESRLRVAAGFVLLALALFIEWPGSWEALPAVLGGVLLATGIVRYCPLNQLLGIGSRESH